jgi:hypothetical protein
MEVRMNKAHLLGIAVALAPVAVFAQGVPSAVVTDVVRTSSSAVVDGIRSNQALIEKEERDKAAAAPVAAQAPQPQPQPYQPPPQTGPVPAPR